MKQRFAVTRRWLGTTALLALTIAAAHGAPDSPLFPRDGESAAHQRSLDMANPTVVMVVALQPGYEDLRLMAYLRTLRGVRTAVVFLTNGEATPGDTISRYPVWMTGERKGEAHRVARFLDAEALFMNLPDLAAPAQVAELATLWDSAGARKRLVEAIRSIQPDMIVIGPDRRGPVGCVTLRDSAALNTVRGAVDFASTTRDTSMSKGLLPWRTGQILVQRPTGALPPEFAKRHPLNHLTPTAIAEQAASRYRTLRLQISEWNEGGCSYHPVTDGRIATAGVTAEQIAVGAPDPGPHLRGIAQSIRTTIRADRRGVLTASLKGVSALIDATERVIVTQMKELDRRERRIAIHWKEGFEDLRCVVRGVSIQAVASDSLLTGSQVFFLEVRADPGTKKRGQTVIIFPLAANGEWVVNEKMGYFFTLDSVSRFTLLTPAEVQYTVPYSEYGLTQSKMDFAFPYVVVHKDTRPELNYMYHREVRLQFGPKRTFALQTPLVFDSPSSPVIVAMQNISRDKFVGDLVLSDTTGEPSHADVEFTRKDEKALDTLFVPGAPAVKAGGRLLLLELSGRGGRRSVTTRAFRVAVDSSIHAGLLSTVGGSTLEEALRVIGQPCTALSPTDVAAGMAGASVLLIDRGYLSDPATTGTVSDGITRWIRGGGHAIVFPQSGTGAAWLRTLCEATFLRVEPVPVASPVSTPWTGGLTAPNAIVAGDWEDWVEMRAGYGIESSRNDGQTTLATRNGTLPLIMSIQVGSGTVTLVAADLQSQFMNYHPGVHRLLADLIALKRH